jgi:hypothetical protein
MTTHSFAQLTDRELLASIHAAANHERAATARLIALLGELDTRRLYLGEGCSSLFTYCTQVLHLSEHAAYNRIETARAARRFPVIFELIEVGAITLTSVRLLAPHLTDANHRDLLEGARHKMKRDVELLIATIRPRADVPSVYGNFQRTPRRRCPRTAGRTRRRTMLLHSWRTRSQRARGLRNPCAFNRLRT